MIERDHCHTVYGQMSKAQDMNSEKCSLQYLTTCTDPRAHRGSCIIQTENDHARSYRNTWINGYVPCHGQWLARQGCVFTLNCAAQQSQKGEKGLCYKLLRALPAYRLFPRRQTNYLVWCPFVCAKYSILYSTKRILQATDNIGNTVEELNGRGMPYTQIQPNLTVILLKLHCGTGNFRLQILLANDLS